MSDTSTDNASPSSSPAAKASPVSAAARLAAKGNKEKRNSTNSVWQTRTLSVGHPDLAELVKAMGLWFHVVITEVRDNPALQPKYPQRNYAIFREEEAPESDELPDAETLTYFIGNIAYIDRVRTKLLIDAYNWKRVLLSTLILGCKVWEEHPVFNTDFGDLFPHMSGKLLGQLEKFVLQLLKFNVSLSGQEYAKFYFQLRDLSPKTFPDTDRPLDDEMLKRLEDRSLKSQEWANPKKPKASQSASWVGMKARKPGMAVQDKHDMKEVQNTLKNWRLDDQKEASK